LNSRILKERPMGTGVSNAQATKKRDRRRLKDALAIEGGIEIGTRPKEKRLQEQSWRTKKGSDCGSAVGAAAARMGGTR